MERFFLTYVLVGLASTAASDVVDDCNIFEFPTAGTASMEVVRTQSVVAELEIDTVELDSQEKEEAWARWEAANYWTLEVANAREALVLSDDRRLAESLSTLRETLDSGVIPRGSWFDLVQLYVFNIDPQLPSVPSDLVERAILELSKTLTELPLQGQTIYQLANARHSLSKGDLEPALSIARALDPDSESITDQYLLGFLRLQISGQQSDENGLQTAIQHFKRLVDSDRVHQCNPVLLGVARMYAAEAHLLRADLMRRRDQSGDLRDEILEELQYARQEIEAGRTNLDVIPVPGLWSLAYWKSYDVYTALMNASLNTSSFRKNSEYYSVLADKARQIASLF